MSNTGYGQDRLYGAIEDDDDFIEEWRSSWEPASHTRVDEVMEQETIAPADQGSDEETQPAAAETAEAAAFAEPEVTQAEPTSQSEADEPETAAGEPDAEPLVAPDDAQDLDLVDWEPEPTTAPVVETSAEAATEEGDARTEEGDAMAEAPSETGAEPDHSVGLTGAAAAALAAASTWGVWGGTPAVPSMPGSSPFQVAEPEPELPPEPQPADALEPETSGLYVPEPEVLTIPEPQPSVAEPASFSPGLVTTPIPEPDMYAAPGLPPFKVPEPEPYVIPEPQPSSEPSPFPPPRGDTTPIPEPGSATAPPREGDEAQAGEQEKSSHVDPGVAAHEQVHAAAGASAAYDLRVDVSSVLGFPPLGEASTPAEDPVIAESAAPVIVSDEGGAMVASTAGDPSGPIPGEVTTHDAPAAEADVVTGSDDLDTRSDDVAPAGDEAFAADLTASQDEASEDPGHEQSEHRRWFDRAKMWAANNLYDPDEDAGDHPQDEQTH